jgi:hypothetical protein
MMWMQDKKYLTRRELVAALREIGYPVSISMFEKLSASSVNQGPPVHSWWGPTALYTLDTGIAWAESMLCQSPRAIQPRQTRGAA